MRPPRSELEAAVASAPIGSIRSLQSPQMRALITGMNGTVGRALAAALRATGAEPIAYPRDSGPVDNPRDIAARIAASSPDVLFHLAIASKPTGIENESKRINIDWPAQLATACSSAKVRFVFTSTAMVFSDNARGPFSIQSVPDAAHGYGLEKRTAEQRVRQANPAATIVRLGWQIGRAPGGNNMLSFFDQHMREKGVVRASRKWLPACSFLEDTAVALIQLTTLPPGLYHADSNLRWTFFEIATALNARAGSHWKIEPTDDFIYDQRLIDSILKLPPLNARLDLAS